MRITSKGQVTIPIAIREKAKLLPHTEVEFACDSAGNVRIFRASKRKSKGKSRGEMLVEYMRKQAPRSSMTTDEIMALTRGED